MEYYIVLLLSFIGILLLTQIILFEVTRRKMKKAQNMNWFLAYEKPFHYNRVSYMFFVCFLCYLIASPESMFSLDGIIYFVMFLAIGIIGDAVTQYVTLFYGKKRNHKEIEEAHLLKNELIEIAQTMTEDTSYDATPAQYEVKSILERFVYPESHLSYMTIDGGKFARNCHIFTEATFVVEPYGDIEKTKENLSDLPVQVTKLTPSQQMPFKDQKIDVVMCEKSNYDKNEIQRILKPGGYFIVNQNGTANLKEFSMMYMPFGMKGSWDAYSCAQTLESIGMRIVEKFEDYGTVRFRTIQSLHTYLKEASPEFSDINKFQHFYLKALKEIKDNGFYEMTTHNFLVVAQRA